VELEHHPDAKPEQNAKDYLSESADPDEHPGGEKCFAHEFGSCWEGLRKLPRNEKKARSQGAEIPAEIPGRKSRAKIKGSDSLIRCIKESDPLIFRYGEPIKESDPLIFRYGEPIKESDPLIAASIASIGD
jgi:hypothetical protein